VLYLIKFIYQTFLLPPGLFIVLFLFLAWRIKRKNPGIAQKIGVLTLAFYLFSTPLVGDRLIHSLESRYQPSSPTGGDVIIMLGGGATLDTPNLNGKGHLSGSAANRLLTSLQLYQKLKVPIIISGGKVFQDTGGEAEIARHILIGAGVPAKKILLEDQSLNTTENAQYTKKVLEKHHYRDPILVTSAFHMLRSVEQFAKAGVKVRPYPTDYYTNMEQRFDFHQLIPSAGALDDVSRALKEYLGLLAIKWY